MTPDAPSPTPEPEPATTVETVPVVAPPLPPIRVRQVVSLAMLGVLSLTFAYLFFRLIRPLFLPLFMAAILAVVLNPTQRRLSARLGGRDSVSAVLILLGLVAILLVPGIYLGMFSYETLVTGIQRLERASRAEGARDQILARIGAALGVSPDRVEERLLQALREGNRLLFENATSAVGDVVSAVLGLFVFLLGLFFFLQDGPRLLAGWEALTPLELHQDRQIRERFSVACRGVVISTFLAALVQTAAFATGLLVLNLAFDLGLGSWLGFYVLLGAVFAMVPFLGVGAVWVPLSIYLAYKGQYWAAGLLALYGGLVIGQLDNLVRVIVLRGTANLHPLVGFISIIGGIKLLGVTGVFVGPIIAAVSVSLLRIVKLELDELSGHPAATG